jgi:intracellular protein transport protein USO1
MLQIEALAKQLENIKIEAKEADERRKETEKEQEDLLVLLDELNAKRRRDKIRMREKGMEVSEDEEEEDDEDDEDDE